ncbi:MAG TPA: BatB protein [Alphaproteobacteria bacterium]|nr:BatB protein [Alphaproteobacteria bacterium]
MFHFVVPLMFVLLPLPLLMRAVLPRAEDQNGEALRVPFYAALKDLPRGRGFSIAANASFRRILAFAVWALVVCAAARPQWAGEPQKISSEGRNLMLVLDVSGSMDEPDFVLNDRPVRRWDAVQAVARRFLKKREGDRVGVVLFGERAYVYAPLTYDTGTVSTLLGEADVGMAGRQTAVGDALGLALKNMADLPAKSKVVVLLSDGVANAGVMKPLEAAEVARKAGVKVYTVGAGSDTVEMAGLFGMMQMPRGDEIDEETLKKIAEMTGGRYFRAKNTAELVEIYDDINALEPVKNDDIFIRPVKELFYIPLAAAFALSVLGALSFLVKRG